MVWARDFDRRKKPRVPGVIFVIGADAFVASRITCTDLECRWASLPFSLLYSVSC